MDDLEDVRFKVPDLPPGDRTNAENYLRNHDIIKIDDLSIHPDGFLNPGQGWACRTRLSFDLTAFDPRCKDCVDAAAGYVDAGNDQMTGYRNENGAHLVEMMFSKWVEEAVKLQREAGIR